MRSETMETLSLFPLCKQAGCFSSVGTGQTEGLPFLNATGEEACSSEVRHVQTFLNSLGCEGEASQW